MPPQMPIGGNGMSGMPMMMQKPQSDFNLLVILIDIAFGFVAGLIIFLGFTHVLSFGTKLADQLVKLSPQGAAMGMFGGATSYATYIVLVPLAGVVAKQLASVNSLKRFGYFALAILGGFAIAFLTQGYFAAMMK